MPPRNDLVCSRGYKAHVIAFSSPTLLANKKLSSCQSSSNIQVMFEAGILLNEWQFLHGCNWRTILIVKHVVEVGGQNLLASESWKRGLATVVCISRSEEESNKTEIVDCCDTGGCKNRYIPILQSVSLWQIFFWLIWLNPKRHLAFSYIAISVRH